MQTSMESGKLDLIYLRPLDLSVDETLAEILDAVHRIDATRVVIDSLSGFEIALAPAFREDFRESLYRLVGALTATGVTMMMTTETIGGSDLGFTTEKVSFITDDIIVQRYVEIDGVLRTVLAVHKMRGSDHSHDFRTYEITGSGAVIGGALRNFRGIMTGSPQRQPALVRVGQTGLTEREVAVLDALVRIGPATIDVLVERVGLLETDLAPPLARLVGLGYAAVTGENGGTYRAVAQVGG
jgi:circadian clock protein KaiC